MSNTTRFEDIAHKTEELAKALRSHDITLTYTSIMAKMKEDAGARAVYEKLVKLGKDIAEAKETGKELDEQFLLENEELKKGLEENPLVKEFVEAQKDYFEMMSHVQKIISSAQ